jgi:predicted GH43/DUF377 family glycosyl hydrolase
MWYSGYDGAVWRIGYASSSDGIEWTKSSMNPVLNPGAPGSWDDDHIRAPTVIFDGTTYHMWYSGCDWQNYRIGYATSSNGITWTKSAANPVIDLGAPGSWDDGQVVAYKALHDGTAYHMWYSGGDDETPSGGSTWRIGYAISADGITWVKSAANPVLDLGPTSSWDDKHVSGLTVISETNVYRMWYSGNDGTHSRVGNAESPDGINWTKRAMNPVLDLGPSGSWDDFHVEDPSVIKDGSIYKMWYTGYDGLVYRIGYATSTNGIDWKKNAGSICLSALGDGCILDRGSSGHWDSAGVAHPTVIIDQSEPLHKFKMWFSGWNGVNWRIGYAYSMDGIIWTKHPAAVLDSGSSHWESIHVYYPSVLKENSVYRMWYSGNGQKIGYAESSDGLSWSRTSLNPVLDAGSSREWDGGGVAVPMVIKDGSIYRMWYEGASPRWRLGYAESEDGLNFTKTPLNPVLDLGLPGTWEDNLVDEAAVIKDGSSYKMWYSGHDGLSYRIGYASAAYGSRFIKQPSNPVLDTGPAGSWESSRVDFPFIRHEGGLYKMWYMGAPGPGAENSQIGYATSTDGFVWTRWSGNPVLRFGSPGEFDSFSLNAHSILYENGLYKMW